MPWINITRTSKAEERVSGTLHRRQTTLGRQPEPSRFASFLCCILVIVVLYGGCFVVHAGPNQEGAASANAIPPAPVLVGQELQQVPAEPSEVLVGAYLYFVRNIDTRANTFIGDFYLWFLWRGDRDPTKSFEIMNAVGAPTIKPVFADDAGLSKPEELPDGRFYQQFHVQGTFGCSMDFSTYPLDSHRLAIELEDTKSTVREILYKVDDQSTTRTIMQHRNDATRNGSGWRPKVVCRRRRVHETRSLAFEVLAIVIRDILFPPNEMIRT